VGMRCPGWVPLRSTHQLSAVLRAPRVKPRGPPGCWASRVGRAVGGPSFWTTAGIRSRSLVCQDKPGPSSSLRGGCHVSADDTCSCGLSRGGNEARGARPVRDGHRAKRPKAVDSEAVSRKPSKVEPGSASLRKVQVAKLPEMLKPARAGKPSAYAPERPAGVGADGAQ
jgi:hypothetical protein